MALTITNHLIRSADTPHTAEFGDGGRTVTWLPGRGLTEGQAAAMETAGAASQIPAGCHPEVYDEGFWSPVDARAGQLGLTGSAVIMQASEIPGPSDGLARGWLWRCRGWWSRSDEDEQA
jgi:hypothetical protein